MGKTWPALDIHVPDCDPQLQDLVLAELDDFQPTAVQEPGEQSKLRAFFTTATDRDAAANALAASFGIHLFVESVDVEDQDWAARSQAGLRAVTVGRVIVAPPWDVPAPPAPGAVSNGDAEFVVVVIHPSMGFGTGHHATTRLMLKAMQTLDLRDREVLDIGCGSGVLAIAAVRLGARSAAALDTDADALASAAENLALNGVAVRVQLRHADFRGLTSGAAVVLANLTGGLLQSSASKLADLVETGGHLIVSGFMDGESAVVPSLERFLLPVSLDREDEWQCAVLVKPSTSQSADRRSQHLQS